MKKAAALISLLLTASVCLSQTNDPRRKIKDKTPAKTPEEVTYEDAFTDIYKTIGDVYPAFDIKGINWKSVGDELLPRAKTVQTDEEFGLLCMELVARLKDSHAVLQAGSAALPQLTLPQWDPGFACLMDDQNRPVVYYADSGSPAENAGMEPGMTVVSINGIPAEQALKDVMTRLSTCVGYSSDRYLLYHAAQMLPRQMEKGAQVKLLIRNVKGKEREFEIPAVLGVRYLPRLPVPIRGIDDDGPVSWTMLEDRIGYLYVRKMDGSLIDSLDRAVDGLSRAKGLIIDVRGNSGGGFDARRSFINFDLNGTEEPERPRFGGPVALLTDARCISAGEGWASWFLANKRATVFGEATAGASSDKRTYPLKNGLYKVVLPVKMYKGFLDRPIEGRGLEPDVPVRQSAADLAAGKDTVLETARAWLLKTISE